MFLPSKYLLSAFCKTLPSKNPSKNLVFSKNPDKRLLRTLLKKHLLLENLLRSVQLHDPFGVHPTKTRAALKGTNLRGQTPICGFLRVAAKICGFLRKSAVFCENLRFPNALFSRKRRESAKICENLRWAQFVPLGSPP